MSGASLHVQRVAGVEMIIAIDSTHRGPALGGCRWRPYASSADARSEARALAAAMTRKAALAGLSLGGGKAVVVGDASRRSEAQLHAFGELVASLEGSYITAADMGTGQAEMAVIGERTEHVVGLPADRGGCGDPGPFTALGVFLAMEAALARHDRAIEGAVVAIQGVGSVGGALAQRLVQAGARVLAADPDDANRAALPESVHVVEPARILDQVCDVLAPCGPARVIDAARAARVRCRIVCGAANNLLGDDAAAGVLQDRGVLLVPDFLANAGGLIHLAVALEGGDDAATLERLRVIPENLARLLATIDREGGEPSEIAGRLALDAA